MIFLGIYIGYEIKKDEIAIFQLIIGKDNIQNYYNNGDLDELRELITKNFSQSDYKELQDIFARREIEDRDSVEINKDNQKCKELLVKLCRNMGQENLADILENAEEILVGDGLELFYKENELLCNYRNNDLYLSDYPIDRQYLLQMDYETFRSFLDENAILEEKKREELRFRKNV